MPVREARKVIAVDLDQTLSDTLQSLVLWHNDTYHTDLDVSKFDTLDCWKVWGGTHEEYCEKIRKFYDSPHFEQIRPVKDFALEALKMLKKRGFQLVIITSRGQFVAERTKKFIDRHYSGIFESIYFCNLNLSEKEQLEYISKPKSVICQEIGVDVLIDDSLEHALDCSHIQVLLYDKQGKYNWNHQSHLPTNVHRVFNWKQIMDRFPKPTSPLKQCIYSFDDGDYFQYYDHHHPSYCQYETIEVEEESSDDDLDYDYPKDTSLCV